MRPDRNQRIGVTMSSAPNLTLILGPGFAGIRPLTPIPSGTAGGSSTTGSSTTGGSETAGSSNGGPSSGAKKSSNKAVPDLRPYDPRPC